MTERTTWAIIIRDPAQGLHVVRVPNTAIAAGLWRSNQRGFRSKAQALKNMRHARVIYPKAAITLAPAHTIDGLLARRV